jgi:hypothetical protein
MNTKYLVVVVALTTAMLTGAATALATTADIAFAYETNQVNDCGDGELPLDIGCQNTASQIQGDENAVSITGQQLG